MDIESHPTDTADQERTKFPAVPVFRVLPEMVTPIWDQIIPILEPALAISSTHNAEDVRRLLLTSQSQLWAQIDDTEVQAFCVTEFCSYPRGPFVRVWLAGARPDRRLNNREFYRLIDLWRQQHRCIGLEAIGRHGWLGRFPKARVEGLVMRLIAEDPPQDKPHE